MEVFAETNHILYADQVEWETGGPWSCVLKTGFASIDCSWSKTALLLSEKQGWAGAGWSVKKLKSQ